jgi:hypothetical protein
MRSCGPLAESSAWCSVQPVAVDTVFAAWTGRMRVRWSWLASILALACACQGRGGSVPADGVTTIPARGSSVEVDDAGAVQAASAVAERIEAGAVLGDPQAVTSSQVGYAGAPAFLSSSAQRWHVLGDLALAEGQWERAVEAFEAVLEEAPDSAQDFRDLALAHAGAGELDLAANALAEALLREFPHGWRDYVHEPGFAAVRASGEHRALEALAARLRSVHARARAEGRPTTVTWAPREGSRGAQAGVTFEGRFLPLAPRVWSTTVRKDASLVVDAYYDGASDRVVNVNATVETELDVVGVEVHDAVTGRVLGHSTLEAAGADGLELDPAELRFREPAHGAPWRDLRGRRSELQDDPAGATVIVRATGLGLLASDDDIHRLAHAARVD